MLTRAHSQTVWLQSPQCFHFRSLPPSLLQQWYLPQVCLPQLPRNTWLLLHSTSFLRASKPTAFLPLRERAGSPLHAQRDLFPKATWAHLRRAVTVTCGPHIAKICLPLLSVTSRDSYCTSVSHVGTAFIDDRTEAQRTLLLVVTSLAPSLHPFDPGLSWSLGKHLRDMLSYGSLCEQKRGGGVSSHQQPHS